MPLPTTETEEQRRVVPVAINSQNTVDTRCITFEVAFREFNTDKMNEHDSQYGLKPLGVLSGSLHNSMEMVFRIGWKQADPNKTYDQRKKVQHYYDVSFRLRQQKLFKAWALGGTPSYPEYWYPVAQCHSWENDGLSNSYCVLLSAAPGTKPKTAGGTDSKATGAKDTDVYEKKLLLFGWDSPGINEIDDQDSGTGGLSDADYQWINGSLTEGTIVRAVVPNNPKKFAMKVNFKDWVEAKLSADKTDDHWLKVSEVVYWHSFICAELAPGKTWPDAKRIDFPSGARNEIVHDAALPQCPSGKVSFKDSPLPVTVYDPSVAYPNQEP